MSPPNVGLTAFGSGSSAQGGSYVSKRPETYGARRDGREVYDAVMTNGSAVLTSASGPFVAADAGKPIHVSGSGSAGAVLNTTILSYQSATQVTLSAAASVTVSLKQAIWGTDDTAAIRSAIDAAYAACTTDKTYYCEIQFSAGIYILSAATTKGGTTRGNAQISLPNREPADGPKVTMVMRGMVDSGAWAHWQQGPGQKSGAVLRTMLTAQTPDGTWHSPSVIGGPTETLVGGGEFSNIRAVLDGITVSAPLNPSIIAADLRRCAQADVPMFSALADGNATQMTGSATDSNGIGMYLPSINNNDSCNVGIYSCEGFYYGLAFSDHLVAHRIGIIYSDTAIFINSASGTETHGSSILYASIEGASTGIEKNVSSGNVYPLWIGQVNSEAVTTAVKDSGNHLRGYIGWTINSGGADPALTGAANIKVENLNRLRGNITAPAVPASTVATTAIAKDAAVIVAGGTVTAITVAGVATGLTSGTVIVPCGKTISITYSVAPTWKWYLL